MIDAMLNCTRAIWNVPLDPLDEVYSNAFGAARWKEIIPDLVVETEEQEKASLPGNIQEILNEVCPFRPMGRIRDSHILVRIPAGITLVDLFKTRPAYTRKPVAELDNHLDVKVEKPYWFLATKTIVPDIADPLLGGDYEFPSLIELCASIVAVTYFLVKDDFRADLSIQSQLQTNNRWEFSAPTREELIIARRFGRPIWSPSELIEKDKHGVVALRKIT